MNPTKSAAPIPKIHRVALVDNDPRALESLSLLIEAKVPTAYVVWTATSGDEAIERCQRNDDNLNLLVLDMSMEGLQGQPSAIGSVSWTGICRFWASPATVAG